MVVYTRLIQLQNFGTWVKLFSCSHCRYISCTTYHNLHEYLERGKKVKVCNLFQGDSPTGGLRRYDPEEQNQSNSITTPFKHVNAHETLELFRQSIASGIKPTRYALCTAISSCGKTLDFRLGFQIHARIIQTGYGENIFLSSTLVDLYAKCGGLLDARRVFDGSERHDQVLWTSMISGLAQNGQGEEAILMFNKMLISSVKPNCFTYVSAISACTKLDSEHAFEHCTLFHTHVIELGLNNNNFVVSALVDCYSKCRRIDQAILLFDETTKRDNIILNSMISGYSFNICGEEALELFMKMRKENLSPTNHTLTSILNACGSLTILQQGRQVHSLVTKMGSENNVFVSTALIDMYSKCGNIDDARCTFDQTMQKNSVLWTSMIMGYAQSGRGSDALELFEHLLVSKGYKPDHVCFTAVLTACVHAGFLDKGVEYFNKMRTDYRLVPELDQYACLMDLYAKNGSLRKAKELIDEMPYDPNSVMWSSFLSSCKLHGEVELGREAANQLFKMEPSNASSYVTLASMYARAGLWTEVAEIRKLMQEKGIRKSAGWSWVEVDKKVHIFSVGDATHPQSPQIYAELEKLSLELKETWNTAEESY